MSESNKFILSGGHVAEETKGSIQQIFPEESFNVTGPDNDKTLVLDINRIRELATTYPDRKQNLIYLLAQQIANVSARIPSQEHVISKLKQRNAPGDEEIIKKKEEEIATFQTLVQEYKDALKSLEDVISTDDAMKIGTDFLKIYQESTGNRE